MPVTYKLHGFLVLTLPGVWRSGIGVRTDLPGVSILWQGEIARLNRSFFLNMAAWTTVQTNSSLRVTLRVLGTKSKRKQEVLPLLAPRNFNSNRTARIWLVSCWTHLVICINSKGDSCPGPCQLNSLTSCYVAVRFQFPETRSLALKGIASC